MKLTLSTTGGFAGPAGTVVRTVEVEALPPGEREHLRRLIEPAQLLTRAPQILLASPRSHDFRYRLAIEDGPRIAQIEFHLEALDPPLRALVEWLEAHVQPRSAFSERAP